MINVVENRSAEFGVSSSFEFLTYYMPKAFGISILAILFGFLY